MSHSRPRDSAARSWGFPSPCKLLIGALLAAATFAAFAGVLRNGWILLDDPIYVVKNPHVNRGWTAEGALWFLHEPHGGNWHPLTSYSHMLDVELFGLEPAGHHATSLALHVLNAVLLLYVLYRLTGAWWRSAVVAGLFALHPLRVESVAWISERKDVLSGFFFLCTIEAYRRWTVRPSAARYALLIVVFALGLMSKPMLVTLPFVLLLLDVWPLRRLAGIGPARGAKGSKRTLQGLILEKWPLFGLAAVSAVVTFLVQRKAGAVVSMGQLPLARRAGNAVLSYWRYLAETVWPSGLAVFYPHRLTVDVLGAILATVGLVVVTWVVLRQLGKRPFLATGWLWYVGMLLPVIGILQVGGQAHADRYTYLPIIGVLVALVWGVEEPASRSRTGRIAAAGVAGIALLAFSQGTVRQVALWKDTRTLFTHTLAVTTNNAMAHKYLGDVLLGADSVSEAIPHYQEAIRLARNFTEARNKLGSALGRLGRYDEAIVQFREALSEGERAEVHHNLGYVYAEQGRFDDAIREFRTALRLAPNFVEARIKLGSTLGTLGRYDEAIAEFREAMKQGETAEIHHNIGFAYAGQGRLDEAIPEFEAALRLDPNHYLSLVRLGRALGAQRRFAESEGYLRRAARLNPEDVETHRLLAVTLIAEGRVEDSIREYQQILRLAPNDLDALVNIAWIRATHAEAAHRNGAEAVRLAERARAASPEPVASIYSTLAAAYAEAGRFREAAAASQRAIELARAAHDAAAAERFSQQAENYRKGKPFHFEK